MHNFVVYSNESPCRKSGRLGLEQVIEEEMPPSEGDRVPPLPQLPSQEVAHEAEVPTKKSSRIWKAAARSLGSKEQESLNLYKFFSVVQGEQEDQQYYEVIHQDKYKIQDSMQNSLSYLASSGPDTMYFDQAVKQPDRKEFLNAAII